MIPTFPSFKKLYSSDKPTIEKYTKKFQPYSDFNFTSLFCYDIDNNIELSILHNNLVILFEDYISRKKFFSFIGNNKLNQTAKILIEEAGRRRIDNRLKLIPEECISFVDDSFGLMVFEDQDNFDYILSVEEIASYKGKKYYDKRNLVNRFKKNHRDYSVKALDLSLENNKEEIIKMFHNWKQKTNKKNAEIKHELKALGKMLEHYSDLELETLGIYADGVLIGFTIKEILKNSYSIIHFEKTNKHYIGSSSFLRQESAIHLKNFGCKYINFEQDLGIPGLRKAKMLWRPVKFLKKYIISQKK